MLSTGLNSAKIIRMGNRICPSFNRLFLEFILDARVHFTYFFNYLVNMIKFHLTCYWKF